MKIPIWIKILSIPISIKGEIKKFPCSSKVKFRFNDQITRTENGINSVWRYVFCGYFKCILKYPESNC